MKLQNFEFSTRPDGNVEVRPGTDVSYILNESHREIIVSLYDRIRDEYPKAFKALTERYARSSKNKMYFEFIVVRGFIKCNWSVYDNTNDIDECGDMRFEFVSCPLRGECEFFEVICNPERNTKLSPSEMNVLRLIAQGKETKQISEELFISPRTVDSHRNNMLKKLDLHNIGALSTYFNSLNIK